MNLVYPKRGRPGSRNSQESQGIGFAEGTLDGRRAYARRSPREFLAAVSEFDC